MSEITGYWIQASAAARCSICCTKHGQVLLLQFNDETMRLCSDCAESLRDLTTNALDALAAFLVAHTAQARLRNE